MRTKTTAANLAAQQPNPTPDRAPNRLAGRQTSALRALPPPPRLELAPVNNLSLKIAPSLGTQLYFPFILDQVDSVVPFTVNVTNSEIFLTRINQKRNFILVSVPPDADPREVGSLFIVAGDRHLNIRLGIGKRAEHTEAVYFSFNEEVQAELIDKAVAKARERLRRQMDRRIAEAKAQSRREAIAYVAELAQAKPSRQRLRANFKGEHHRLYLSRSWRYPGFGIVFAEIEALAGGEPALAIDSFSLSYADGQSRRQTEGYLRCEAREAKQQCTAVFDQLGDWDSHEGIEIDIKSNRGRDVFAY